MKTILQLTLITSIILSSCSQQKSEQTQVPDESAKVQEMKSKVMAVHDEVMPLMSDIYQLKTQLGEKLKDSAKIGEAKTTELKAGIIKLDSARQGMLIWMRQFGDVKTAGVPEEKALSDLQIEMEKISKVKSDMLSSVELGKKLSSE